jgi:fatty acid-binding protein DegV
MRNHVANSEPIHVAVMHADALEEARELKKKVASEFNCAEIFITDFSPIMGYATGRGTLALAYYKEDRID